MFFAPDDKADQVRNLIGYCLAYTAGKYGVRVHGCVFMSNHHHTDVSDPQGNMVGFTQQFHSLLARGINALRGRFDTVWACGKPCQTRRPSDDETLDDLVYTLTNPVSAELVKRGELWPGFTTQGWRFGETREFRRPAFLFDPDGDMPAVVKLTLERPPILDELSDDELFELLMARVRGREKDKQSELRTAGRRFMGLEKLRRQRWSRAPSSHAERFQREPRVATTCRWLLQQELQRDRHWERRYADARASLLAGLEVVFPAGTYWLRRYAGVRVEALPVQGRAPP